MDFPTAFRICTAVGITVYPIVERNYLLIAVSERRGKQRPSKVPAHKKLKYYDNHFYFEEIDNNNSYPNAYNKPMSAAATAAIKNRWIEEALAIQEKSNPKAA